MQDIATPLAARLPTLPNPILAFDKVSITDFDVRVPAAQQPHPVLKPAAIRFLAGGIALSGCLSVMWGLHASKLSLALPRQANSRDLQGPYPRLGVVHEYCTAS